MTLLVADDGRFGRRLLPQDLVLRLLSSLLSEVERALRPDVLRRKHGEPGDDQQEPWAGKGEQREADGEQEQPDDADRDPLAVPCDETDGHAEREPHPVRDPRHGAMVLASSYGVVWPRRRARPHLLRQRSAASVVVPAVGTRVVVVPVARAGVVGVRVVIVVSGASIVPVGVIIVLDIPRSGVRARTGIVVDIVIVIHAIDVVIPDAIRFVVDIVHVVGVDALRVVVGAFIVGIIPY
jgi:hypothetical protein